VATILIVDDDETLVSMIASRLAAVGHTCHAAGNGERALALLTQEPIDLVLLDVMIPGMSGFELCRRIHTSSELYSIPVLFMSAMNDEEEIAHGLAQGADDYLTKPFRGDVLLARVQNLLASRAQDRKTDELTSLLGSRHIKLEVQKAINLRRPFSVAYIEVVHINEFARAFGNEARARAMRHMGRAIALCGEKVPGFLAGHMGGGHFVCILEPEEAEPYCRNLQQMWHQHLAGFFESLGIPESAAAPNGARPRLDVLCCVAPYQPSPNTAAQHLFETLTRLRQSALSSTGAGIHIDRRG
jgi:CheY-like chemotaxis protein